MRRSHVCTQCGTDLARVHAPPDPHYGLPVVVCPRCEAASVRRPHAGAAAWRTLHHLRRARAGIVLRVLVVVLLVLLVGSLTATVADELSSALRRQPISTLFAPDDNGARDRLAKSFADTGRWTALGWAGAWATTGLAAGVLFPHWKLRWVVVGVPTAVVGVVGFVKLLGAVAAWGNGAGFRNALIGDLPLWRDAQTVLVPVVIGAALAMMVFVIGKRSRIRLHTNRGLGSRRLKRARRRKRREA